MDSLGTPDPWTPPPDCSQPICTAYCPQWCYIIFPPPPPFDYDDHARTNLSPLIIVVIAILAAAFLVIAYYTVISKYCRRRGALNASPELESSLNELHHGSRWEPGSGHAGLDEAMINSIAVCKYAKGDGLVEGTECAVCLAEFRDGESLRLLPKCGHAFHLPCIDTWLKSQSNCPLCRAAVVAAPPPSSQNSNSTLNISALEIRHRNDLVLVVDDRERVRREEVVLGVASDPPLRRSVSMVSVADILQVEEHYEDLEMEIQRSPTGIGSSQENGREIKWKWRV
ncbi:RING-H2 finger protein ATL51-like [Diospyros lotus]|uniref:RING-H2 finger protein ATL51-like n=1 Tax=Diospyros lotus TaxID=55363 RepID=UPI0022558ED0|nr:RING-H2 finger protein ATL51-like [Diospyros lotus]